MFLTSRFFHCIASLFQVSWSSIAFSSFKLNLFFQSRVINPALTERVMRTQWENIDNNRKEFVHEVYRIDLVQVHPVRNERRSRGTRARKVQLVPTGSCGCDCGLKAIFLSQPVTFFFDSLETIDFLLIAYILEALSVDINGYGSPCAGKLWLGIASYL